MQGCQSRRSQYLAVFEIKRKIAPFIEFIGSERFIFV